MNKKGGEGEQSKDKGGGKGTSQCAPFHEQSLAHRKQNSVPKLCHPLVKWDAIRSCTVHSISCTYGIHTRHGFPPR